MTYKDDHKYSVEDFESFDAIDALGSEIDNNYNKNDSDGFTPLCFATLNNVVPLMLLYLVKAKPVNPSEENFLPKCFRESEKVHFKRADPTKVCYKGKTPLQMAIMSGNAAAVETLLGSKRIEVVAQQKIERSSTYSYYKDIIEYKNGLPVMTTNEEGKEDYKYKKIEIVIDSSEYALVVTKSDILNASSMPKVDILKALGDSGYSGPWYDDNTSDGHASGKVFNNYNYTPLMMATTAQCYDSIDYIISKLRTADIDSPYDDSVVEAIANDITYIREAIKQKHDKVADTDKTDQSSLGIAVSNKDVGIILKFAPFLNSEDYSSIDGIDSNDWSWPEDLDSTSLRITASADDPITFENYIIYKIKEVNNTQIDDIFKLVADNFIKHNEEDDTYTASYIEHYLGSLKSSASGDPEEPCYNILNYLYKEGYLNLTKDYGDITYDILNADNNKQAIEAAVENYIYNTQVPQPSSKRYPQLDCNKLNRWPWWEEQVNNDPIVIISQPEIIAAPGVTVTLNASGSYDPDGDDITYKWFGEGLSDHNSSTPTFTVPSDISSTTNYTFTVTVSDNHGGSSSASVIVTAIVKPNNAPVVMIESSLIEALPGVTVTLDAHNSYDPDGDSISCLWSGSSASQLIGSDTLTPTFKIPEDATAGTSYTFTITITDDKGAHSSGEITVKALANPEPPPEPPEPTPSTIGTYAFSSGVFSVIFVDDTDKMCTVDDTVDTVTNVWSVQYDPGGYTVQQIPKSPYWAPASKVFNYDLLYQDDSDD